MSSALQLLSTGKVLNFRYSGHQSIPPYTNPDDHNHAAYEWRNADQIGADESCSVWLGSNDNYHVKSPNGKCWLSITPNGKMEERESSGQPGAWETFIYDPDHQTIISISNPSIIFKVLGDQPSQSTGGAGFIHADGHSFKTADGKDWPFLAFTMHTLSSSSFKGENLNEILDEPVELGYNTIVVINMHRSEWKIDNGYYIDPFQAGYDDAIAKMYDACAKRGLYVAAAVLADCNRNDVPVGMSDAQILSAWHKNINIARGRWNVFLRGGNEDLANGYDCNLLDRPTDMGGVLCSRGSRGINVPPSNFYWDFIEWEGRRDPYHKALDDAGAGVLELLAGYESKEQGKVGPFPCPVLQIEPPVFNDTPTDSAGDRDRWTDPRKALHLGVNITANCPGGAFLASDGMVCRRLGGTARECATQFLRGMKAGFVR